MRLVADVFAPGGALERALEQAGRVAYEPRPEQAALAAAVERALATGEHLVAEAGTGVGKSLAYLVPALESGLRVVVATATKALQEQLLAQDVPVAAAVVGRAVDVQVLKGRANYLCRRQLQGFQPFLMADGRDARSPRARPAGSSGAASGCSGRSRRRRGGSGCARCPRRRRSYSSTRSATWRTRSPDRARSSMRCRGGRSRRRARSRRASRRMRSSGSCGRSRTPSRGRPST